VKPVYTDPKINLLFNSLSMNVDGVEHTVLYKNIVILPGRIDQLHVKIHRFYLPLESVDFDM
jgi:hypothetical protein